jgi:hypothetical protein
MDIGKIIWSAKGRSIVSVTKNGIVQKYFLLDSRIHRSPEFITVGQYVKFEGTAPAPKTGLLPVILAAEVSNTPFTPGPPAVSAGLDAVATQAGA